MQSVEKIFRKIEKEAIKIPIDLSDIIPPDTLNIFTQDESSIKKQLFNHFISDSVSIYNKLSV